MGRRLLFALIFVLTAGCFPMKTQYFEPLGQGGTITKMICGSFGPPAKIEFIRDGIHLEVMALPKTHTMDISLMVPPGTSVSLASDQVKVQSRAGDVSINPTMIVRRSYTMVPNSRVASKIVKTVLPIGQGQTFQG